MRSWCAVGAVVLLTSALHASPAQAEQRIRIDCSNVIDEPGTYVVRNSVRSCVNGLGVIQITSDDVTLDLGGNLIDGNGDPDCDAGIIATGSLVNVKVRNGTVSDCINGVEFQSAVTRSSVTDMRVIRNTETGILVADDNKIANNVASHNEDGIDAGDDNVIKNNDATANTVEGIRTGDGNEISGNRSSGNGVWGITTSAGATVVGNIVRGNSTGIYAGSAVVVRDNVVEGNESYAVQSLASSGAKILGNTIRGNGQGIYANYSNTIAENVITGNASYGIQLIFDGHTVRDNVASGNGNHGIIANDPDVSIISNRASGNTSDGIEVDNATAETTIKRNVTNDNEQHGIEATALAIGTGTNKATGNGAAPPECIPADLCV